MSEKKRGMNLIRILRSRSGGVVQFLFSNSNRFLVERIFQNDGRMLSAVDADIGTMIDGLGYRLEMAIG